MKVCRSHISVVKTHYWCVRCEEEEDNEEGYEEVENTSEKEKVGVSEEQKDESEDEEEEGETHSRLLSAISDLDHQRKRGQRSEATPTVSQFQLSTDGECYDRIIC